MDYGAKSFCTNKIGKTASELAAFVGQHECVSIINNHIGIDEIDSLLNTKVSGEVVEKYPDDLVTFIHDLCKTHQVCFIDNFLDDLSDSSSFTHIPFL